jgi:hypothetical protein
VHNLRLCTGINGQSVERLIPEPGDQTKARVPREQEEGGFKVGKILLLLFFMTSPVIAESTLREKMAREPGQQGWFPGAGHLGNMQPITDSEIESFPAVDSTDECRDVKRPDGSPMYSKAGQLGNCIIEERNKASYSKAMWRNATSTTKKVCLAFARAKIAGDRGVFFYRLLSTCLGIRIPIDDQLQAEEE